MHIVFVFATARVFKVKLSYKFVQSFLKKFLKKKLRIFEYFQTLEKPFLIKIGYIVKRFESGNAHK